MKTDKPRDFDNRAINFYNKYYNEQLKENKQDYIYKHNKKEIIVSGDVCFNISLKRGKYFTLFGSIVKDINNLISSEFDRNVEILRYSPMNISITPKKGGLNNIKKSIGNDRFDTFVWLMDLYYKGIRVPIINSGVINMDIKNKKILAEFLDSYDSVNEYFNDIYGLESDFIDKLKKSGEKEITTKDSFFEYICLALEFFELRLSQYKIKNYINDEEKKYYTDAIDDIKKILKKCK